MCGLDNYAAGSGFTCKIWCVFNVLSFHYTAFLIYYKDITRMIKTQMDFEISSLTQHRLSFLCLASLWFCVWQDTCSCCRMALFIIFF